MPAPPFLRLQDVVLPPPLPAIVEIAMVAGVAYLGCRIALRLRGDKAEALDFAAGFVAVVAIAAGVLHGCRYHGAPAFARGAGGPYRPG